MALSTRSKLRTLALLAAFAGLAIAGSSLLASAVAAEDNACPNLTQAKYPFLTCEPNTYGGVTLRMSGYTPPLECHLRVPSGECAASPEPWRPPFGVFGSRR